MAMSDETGYERRYNLFLIGVSMLLAAIFGTLCVYSVMNTTSTLGTCLTCVNGSSPSFAIGQVITLPCGSPPSVVNTGNTSALVLNFAIPGDCPGIQGRNGSSTLIILSDTATTIATNTFTYNISDRIIYINATNDPSPVLPLGPIGGQGIVGITGPKGNKGPQGIQGIPGEPFILDPMVRYTTPGLYFLAVPPGASAMFYVISGAGGGGGGASGGPLGGNGGGGGGSGRRLSGVELLTGVSGITIAVGAGGTPGISTDSNGPLLSGGGYGEASAIQISPVILIRVEGGEGGYRPPFYDMGGLGGDGGMGGGAGGSCHGRTNMGGDSMDIEEERAMYDGESTIPISSGGAHGAGSYSGTGGGGAVDSSTLLPIFSGGGGGGGGYYPLSGGNGGTWVNTINGAGTPGLYGGGGGGAGGTLLGGVSFGYTVVGYNGGRGGDGYVEILFI